jgi:hypothetical protein
VSGRTAYGPPRDGTTHVLQEPLDLQEKLSALFNRRHASFCTSIPHL